MGFSKPSIEICTAVWYPGSFLAEGFVFVSTESFPAVTKSPPHSIHGSWMTQRENILRLSFHVRAYQWFPFASSWPQKWHDDGTVVTVINSKIEENAIKLTQLIVPPLTKAAEKSVNKNEFFYVIWIRTIKFIACNRRLISKLNQPCGGKVLSSSKTVTNKDSAFRILRPSAETGVPISKICWMSDISSNFLKHFPQLANQSWFQEFPYEFEFPCGIRCVQVPSLNFKLWSWVN